MSDPTLDKWRQKIAKNEAVAESAAKVIKKFIKTALQEPETKKNIAKDTLAAYRDEARQKPFRNDGFGGIGYDITGYEQMPYEDEDEFEQRRIRNFHDDELI